MMLRIVCVAAASLALSTSAALVVLPPASATSSLTKEQAENIAAQHIQMEEQSPNTQLSEIKEYFLFSVLANRGTTSYCGEIRRPTWVIGISPDRTQGWRTGAAWNGGYPFLIDAVTGKILDCRS
jgi:hypothetical protein